MKSKVNYSQPAGYKWAIDRKINLLFRQERYPSGQKSYDGYKICPHGLAGSKVTACPHLDTRLACGSPFIVMRARSDL